MVQKDIHPTEFKLANGCSFDRVFTRQDPYGVLGITSANYYRDTLKYAKSLDLGFRLMKVIK